MAAGPRDAGHHGGGERGPLRGPADAGDGVPALLYAALPGLRLQNLFPKAQNRAPGQVLQSPPRLPGGLGPWGEGHQIYRLRRRRGPPQGQGAGPRRKGQEVSEGLPAAGVGLGPGHLHPGRRGGGSAQAGQVQLLFLPLHEKAGGAGAAAALPGPVCPRPGDGGRRPARPHQNQGPGPPLVLAGVRPDHRRPGGMTNEKEDAL